VVKAVAAAGRSRGLFLKYLRSYTSLLVELAKLATVPPGVLTVEALRVLGQIWKVRVEEQQIFEPG
jgi:hypothetical protein